MAQELAVVEKKPGGQLAKLNHLWFYFCRLSGTFPRQFGELSSLRRLDISHNAVSGTIPPLGKLTLRISHVCALSWSVMAARVQRELALHAVRGWPTSVAAERVGLARSRKYLPGHTTRGVTMGAREPQGQGRWFDPLGGLTRGAATAASPAGQKPTG